MVFLYFLKIFFVVSNIVSATGTPASQVELLKKVDAKYLAAKTISMNVNKTDKLSALDQTKNSTGTLQMKKGRFRLQLENSENSKEKSQIIVDGKTLWYIVPPIKGEKDSKTQVAKTNLKNKKSGSQSLLKILTEGGVFQFFDVVKSVEDGDLIVYFLKPNKASTEMQKAQLMVSKEKQTISQLKYSDAIENETTYQFTSIEFDKPIKDSEFSYSPPKDAQITQY